MIYPIRCFLRKALLVGLFLSVAVSPLAGREAGAAVDPLTPGERAFVAAHGPILYAPDPEFPPFEFLDSSGIARGITPDLLTIMGKRLGVEFRSVAYPTWSDALEAVKRGKVDLLGTLTRTPEREGFLLFSRPYLSVPYVLFVRQNGGDPETIEDLVSRRLGVVRNYGINTWLAAEHPKIHPVAVEDPATGLTMVATGQLDALLEALPVGAHIVREKSLTNIRIVPRHIYTLPQHLGVSKGEPLLLSIAQKGLDSLTETDRSEAFVRWTGQDFSRPSPAISPLIRNVLLILAAAAVLSLAWIVALRRSVRRATQSLRESEERFRVLSEQSPLGMALIDRQGRYEYVNPAFVSMFGYTLEEIPTGADWFRVAFPDPEVRAEVIRAWKEDHAGAGVGEARPRSFDVACKDGAPKSIQFRPVSLSSDRQFVIYEDVTRQRELQAQLQQAMKMEAVGRLAGGVAHDFNNLLTVIIGNVSLALGKVQQSAPVAGMLSEVNKAAERAATVDAAASRLLPEADHRAEGPEPQRPDRGPERDAGPPDPGGYRHTDPPGKGPRSGQGRRGPVPAGPRQPGGERTGCDAGRRGDRHRDLERGAGRRLLRQASLCQAGKVRHGDRERHGARDEQGGQIADIRAVLHHEGERERDRAWAWRRPTAR